MKKLLIILLLIFQSTNSLAKIELPILKANSALLTIKEGKIMHFESWEASSKIALDEYVYNDFEGESTITFISDIDRISFKVKPNQSYDFIVLLNGKDKAHTRISTDENKEAPPYLKLGSLPYTIKGNNDSSKPIVLPFTIGKDKRIYLRGKINDSEDLKIIFDTGANAVAVKSSIIGRKVNLKLDGETKNTGSDGKSIEKTSSKNKIQIADLFWNDVRISSTNYDNNIYKFDVVLGWIAFAGKVVEIDYQKQQLIIHNSLPDNLSDYTPIDTAMIRGIPYISITMTAGNKSTQGWFEYDTGAVRSIYLSQHFKNKHQLDTTKMGAKLSSYGSSGSNGSKFTRDIYRIPELTIGGFHLYNVPIAIAKVDPKGVYHNDLLGGKLLNQFNAIIDLKNYSIYLKPNNLIYPRYKKETQGVKNEN